MPNLYQTLITFVVIPFDVRQNKEKKKTRSFVRNKTEIGHCISFNVLPQLFVDCKHTLNVMHAPRVLERVYIIGFSVNTEVKEKRIIREREERSRCDALVKICAMDLKSK